MREALDILEPTDALLLQVRRPTSISPRSCDLAGDGGRAREAIANALVFAELKKSSVMAAAAKEALAAAAERSLVELGLLDEVPAAVFVSQTDDRQSVSRSLSDEIVQVLVTSSPVVQDLS